MSSTSHLDPKFIAVIEQDVGLITPLFSIGANIPIRLKAPEIISNALEREMAKRGFNTFWVLARLRNYKVNLAWDNRVGGSLVALIALDPKSHTITSPT